MLWDAADVCVHALRAQDEGEWDGGEEGKIVACIRWDGTLDSGCFLFNWELGTGGSDMW